MNGGLHDWGPPRCNGQCTKVHFFLYFKSIFFSALADKSGSASRLTTLQLNPWCMFFGGVLSSSKKEKSLYVSETWTVQTALRGSYTHQNRLSTSFFQSIFLSFENGEGVAERNPLFVICVIPAKKK